MYRKEVNEQSPLRILEQSIHGGLGPGRLGVVMARAGVGKTACLVQIALDDLLRERAVLHIALDQTVEHVKSWYEALFADLADRTALADRSEAHALMTRQRMIYAFAGRRVQPDRLQDTVQTLQSGAGFLPRAILIDGYDWAPAGGAPVDEDLRGFKALAEQLGAELWMSACTHRQATGDRPSRVPPPCDTHDSLIDVAIFLAPRKEEIVLRLLKDYGEQPPLETHLRLHPDTLRLMPDSENGVGAASAARTLPTAAFTLLSGGAAGAESEFGACAERWGVKEATFTFAGRTPRRLRGLVCLSAEELEQGAVSDLYLRTHMNREYPDSPTFKKMLQTIWHQVSTAGEVFTVGQILPDDTVKGGTGWAAELARHWSKPLHVYDQERCAWFDWRDGAWREEQPPKILSRRFTGTGTRWLTDDGRAAIQSLFERTFGPAATMKSRAS